MKPSKNTYKKYAWAVCNSNDLNLRMRRDYSDLKSRPKLESLHHLCWHYTTFHPNLCLAETTLTHPAPSLSQDLSVLPNLTISSPSPETCQ